MPSRLNCTQTNVLARTHLNSIKVLAIIILLESCAFGQNKESIVIGQRVHLHSDVMGEDRELWIYNPDTSRASTARYPVMYLLDGDYHFVHTVGIVQFLTNVGQIPQLIIVGIANSDRMRDLTPPPADTSFPGSGGGDAFLRFIEDELIPNIDVHYRTTSFRILVGHSLGGTFALNAFLTRPELFGGYILVSPNLWWGNNELVDRFAAFLQKPGRAKVFVYETQTVWESPRQFNQVQRMLDLTNTYRVGGLEWGIHIVQDETHASIVHKSIYDGLEYIYAPWPIHGDPSVLGMSGIQEHFRELSNRYGYRIDPPESMINQLGYHYLFQSKYSEAISVFKWNVEHYPSSSNVYDSMGEAYVKSGETALAIENYEKSIALNPDNKAAIETLKKLKAK